MDEKEIRATAEAEKLQKEIEKLDNDIKIKTARKQEFFQKLKAARSKARTKKGLDTFDSIVVLLGLKEAEEKCVTIADYAKLQKYIIAQVSELQEFKKNYADVNSEQKQSSQPEGD